MYPYNIDVRLNEFGGIKERIFWYTCIRYFVCECDIIWDGLEPVRGSLYYVLSTKPFVSFSVRSGKWSKRQRHDISVVYVILYAVLLPGSGHAVRWRWSDNFDVCVLYCRITCPRIAQAPHLFCSDFLRIRHQTLLSYARCLQHIILLYIYTDWFLRLLQPKQTTDDYAFPSQTCTYFDIFTF